MLGRIDIIVRGPPQAVMTRIYEGAIHKLHVHALNSDLAQTTPTSARYRIDNLTDGTTIKDWTTLTPSTSMDVLISAADNALTSGCSRERRQVVIEASDSDGAVRVTHEYDLIDLQGA